MISSQYDNMFHWCKYDLMSNLPDVMWWLSLKCDLFIRTCCTWFCVNNWLLVLNTELAWQIFLRLVTMVTKEIKWKFALRGFLFNANYNLLLVFKVNQEHKNETKRWIYSVSNLYFEKSSLCRRKATYLLRMVLTISILLDGNVSSHALPKPTDNVEADTYEPY